MSYVEVDESDFVVETIDAYGILIRAAWGVQSFVSSWHLVDERKIQLTRRTKPVNWDAQKQTSAQAAEGEG